MVGYYRDYKEIIKKISTSMNGQFPLFCNNNEKGNAILVNINKVCSIEIQKC